MIKDRVLEILSHVLKTDKISLLSPKDPTHGDYALFIKPETPSMKDMINQLSANNLFSKIEQVGGFINFHINPIVLKEEMYTIIEQREAYGQHEILKSQRIIVEFAHPNTHKLFHIGHLRNIITGEALSKLLEKTGATVIRANYQGDVGLHIAKCLWAILQRKDELKNLKNLDEKISFLGKTYTQGTVAYEEDPQAKEIIHTINKQIFTKDPDIMQLWKETRGWSLEYFDRIYKRVGTTFERLFFESEVADRGLAIAKKALKDKILTKSDGAVIFDGTKYGIDKRVFINSLGLPTYEGKELGLAELEFSEFGEIDRCIHVVTPEQTSFFKVVFKVEELLDPKKYKNKQHHFAYEFVELKSEKMSSRVGNIVTGEWLLDEIKKRIQKTYHTASKNAIETIMLGAVKYAFLKVDARKKIKFDIEESISIHGNSGPYLQYTYARCMSVINNANMQYQSISTSFNQFQLEELSLLRALPRFPEVVADAAHNYTPHLIATYLYDLAQKFNLFYEKCPILKADDDVKTVRLQLTAASAQIIKNGLHLLGINILNKI